VRFSDDSRDERRERSTDPRKEKKESHKIILKTPLKDKLSEFDAAEGK
jgi:hypothetical protein